jgi:hypothetical protein
MTERTCENCRWFDENPILDNDGFCRRNPPTGDGSDLPRVEPKDLCGEWSDKTMTPEQEEMRELTRRFAVAIMSTVYGVDLQFDAIWDAAKKMAAAEPQTR